MAQPLPSYSDPPVVETALSVLFKPIKGFGNAHLGLFWNKMREEFPNVNDAEPIESQEEVFDGHRQRLPKFRFSTSHQGARLQMEAADGHLMVQLQNGRLAFNWRRLVDGEYPRWTKVYPKFQGALAKFRDFLKAENLSPIEPTQWEVTDVNKFIRGREWDNITEWADVIPGLIGTATKLHAARLETTGANWHFILPEKAGRLHLDMTHAFAGPESDAPEFLVLQLTARGGMDEEKGHNLAWGLGIGHEAIVKAFSEITGEAVQAKWGLEK